MSKIYLVERDGAVSAAVYDCFNGHVVVASSPTKARELCFDEAADEGEQSWVAAKVTVLGDPKDPTPRIILSDFNAG